jgi:hypothetical protein
MQTIKTSNNAKHTVLSVKFVCSQLANGGFKLAATEKLPKHCLLAFEPKASKSGKVNVLCVKIGKVASANIETLLTRLLVCYFRVERELKTPNEKKLNEYDFNANNPLKAFFNKNSFAYTNNKGEIVKNSQFQTYAGDKLLKYIKLNNETLVNNFVTFVNDDYFDQKSILAQQIHECKKVVAVAAKHMILSALIDATIENFANEASVNKTTRSRACLCVVCIRLCARVVRVARRVIYYAH